MAWDFMLNRNLLFFERDYAIRLCILDPIGPSGRRNEFRRNVVSGLHYQSLRTVTCWKEALALYVKWN